MAYQTRQRDPLLDSQLQEALKKRGSELVGFGLLALALVLSLMLASYTPEDPSWISATSAPAKNAMGHYGALIAGALILTIGWSAWTLPLLAGVWGIRMVLHWGENRGLSRIVLIPIFIAFSAIFLSSNIPPAAWPHGSGLGLGGVSGDGALVFLIDLFGASSDIVLALITIFLGIISLALAIFTLGFNTTELRRIFRLSLVSILLVYHQIATVTGKMLQLLFKGGVTSLSMAQTKTAAFKAKRAQSAALAQESSVKKTAIRAMPVAQSDAPATATPLTKLGLSLPKISILKRNNTPKEQSVEPSMNIPSLQNADMPEENVQSKISAAIRRKVGDGPSSLGLSIHPQAADQTSYPIEPTFSSNVEDDLYGDLEDTHAVLDDVPHVDAPMTVPQYSAEPINTPAMQDKASASASVVQQPVQKPIQQSKKAKEEAQPNLFEAPPSGDYEIPALSLLSSPSKIVRHQLSNEALEENARLLENVLDDYGVKGEIVSVRPGPVVTMYELEPAPGLKASRVIGLADDIARSMSALSARVSTVPGRSVIGIELPNESRETVLLREIISARDFGDGNQNLPLALGKDISGVPIVANLAKMPHLLIAGTTGSGKSVAINTMILSLLYKLTPEECRLIMIDPKMLELSVYDGIPHLLSPVVTDPKKAVVALKWAVGEMEDRYRKMSKMGVRNISGYNSRVQDALDKGEDFKRTVQTGFNDETGEPVFETETFQPEKLPYIVVVVDEMADLMMVAGKEIEACIQRLAQMARASGIHLIMATQRPSVDVITGTIKANFPTRISFQVTSKIDSRTILGEMGAEQLLGMGDMLYMAGGGKITRIHAPFVSDEEVEDIVNHLKSYGPPVYMSSVVEGPSDEKGSDIDLVLGLGGNTDKEDALYDTAVAIVARDRKCSTSYIQRKLAIGYNKAARLVEQMEDEGIVSSANHVGKREILIPER